MKKNVLIIVGIIVSICSQAQITKTQIGATRYDLQTNNSIERRVAVDPATGNVIVCYTGASDNDDGAGAFASRGTGYAFWNGTSWKDAQNNTLTPPVTSRPPKPEASNDRTGWPNPILLTGGAEAFVAHRASSNVGNGLVFGKRNSAGNGSWTLTSASTEQVTWPRMANSGDSIVIITSTLDGTLFNMKGGIGYKRSFDGGKTWTPDSASGFDSIPGINENVYGSGASTVLGGDEYALDVKGKVIAVLTGAIDVTLFKSTDFGNTWTKTEIVKGDNLSGAVQDFDNRSSGDYSVLIGNDEKVHCFWGRNSSDGTSIRTQEAGIMYWSENMPSGSKPKVLYKTFYLKDGPRSVTNVPRWTALRFNATGDEQRSYNKNHVSSPSSGIDAAGNIYLSFMRLRGVSDSTRYIADKQTDASGMLLNDVYLIKSIDGGSNWIGPLNVSNSDSMESAYPSIARHVDNNVHMVYQEDTLYGFCISNTAVSHNGVATNNKIIYAKIPVGDIVTPTDITPPMLQRKDSFQEWFPYAEKSFNPGTLNFIQNCDIELTSGKKFIDWSSFVNTYIASAFDNVTENNLIVLDTPSGIKLNTPGSYPLTIYARDAAGNVSDAWNKRPLQGGDTTYYDKMVFQVNVTSSSKPIITISPKTIYHYLGTPFTSSNLPSISIKPGNPCGGSPINVLPTASQVDVNTVGVNNLIVSSTEGTSAVSDTFQVYVGTEPTPVISEESVNSSTKKLNAKGEESDTMSFGKTTYQWKYKDQATSFKTLTGATKTNLVNFSIPSSVLKFDSICLEATNLYNAAPFNKAKKTVCNGLKYSASISNISSKDLSVSIFPNPNNGVFNIRVHNSLVNKEAKVTIYDNSGRVILSNLVKVGAAGIIPINNEPMAKGNYVITTEIGTKMSSDLMEIK